MATGIAEYLGGLERPALLAEESSPLDGLGDVLSSQGGTPLSDAGDTWPQSGGRPMFPMLCVSTGELPYVPPFLAEAAYWVFFIQPDEFEQTVADGSLVVRRYQRIEGLRPLTPPDGRRPQRIELRFRETLDFPGPFALAQALQGNPELLSEYEGHADFAARRFPCHSGIKLGGYPHMIQGTAFLESLDPDYQAQVDSTALYSYGDSGIGYLYDELRAVIWECM